MADSVSLAWLISRLTNLATEHGYDTPVYIHDADTDWAQPIGPEGIRFGLDEHGDGKEDVIMIKSKGYGND